MLNLKSKFPRQLTSLLHRQMAPVKRPRVESTADADAPVNKRPRGRAVSSRVDTGRRAAAGADRQPPRQRPPLKRPPMAPRQPRQDRPAAGTSNGAVTIPKVGL